MKRRDFLATAGAGFGAVATSAHSAPLDFVEPLGPDAIARMTPAIRAQFGGGFVVTEARRKAGETICIIEHKGNRLRIAAQGDAPWQIRGATDM